MGLGNAVFGASLLAAVAVIFVPAFLADPSDAQRLGFFGEDYEGNLCGQLAWRADGQRGRDLRARPFAYWANATTRICVHTCPRLADELVCEYPLESLHVGARRAQLGKRCFAQLRTRTAFPACLPHAPSAARPVDLWLQRHAIDQLAADTLQASAVILGCWLAASLAALACLVALLVAPRLLLVATMLGALAIAGLGAALLLPHGARSLATARAPLDRNEASYWREELPGVLQFALGWAACAGVVLLVVTLCGAARRAPIAAALLPSAARPLYAMPSLLILPLYLLATVGTPLASWITAVVYLAAPCGEAEGCSAGAAAARLLWPLTLSAPYWLATAVTAWAYCAVGGAVGRWYSLRVASSAPGAPSGERPRGGGAWPLWVSGWLSLDAHFGAIGSAAALLPLAGALRILIPPVLAPPRRAADPYTRCCLGALQGCLRCAGTLTRAIHPGGLVYLARRPPIGAPPPTPAPHGGGGERGAAEAAEATEGGGYAGGGYDAGGGYVGGGEGDGGAPSSFVDGGEACALLYARSRANIAAARDACHYFYSLVKWTVAAGVGLTGWLCLTAAEAKPLLSPIWPTAIIIEGSLALVSAALAVHEAALEAVVQSYIEEVDASGGGALAHAGAHGKGGDGPALVGVPAAANGLAAVAVPNYGAMGSAAPLLSGRSAERSAAGADDDDEAISADEILGELPHVPPSFDTLPLSAAALAAA